MMPYLASLLILGLSVSARAATHSVRLEMRGANPMDYEYDYGFTPGVGIVKVAERLFLIRNGRRKKKPMQDTVDELVSYQVR